MTAFSWSFTAKHNNKEEEGRSATSLIMTEETGCRQNV